MTTEPRRITVQVTAEQILEAEIMGKVEVVPAPKPGWHYIIVQLPDERGTFVYEMEEDRP